MDAQLVPAVATRHDSTVNINPVNGGVIPFLGQLVRDYIDQRECNAGQYVLAAYVNDITHEVDELYIDQSCATEYADRVSSTRSDVYVRDLS